MTHPDSNMMAWAKILSAWAAGAWATFSLHGFLQLLVLILAIVGTVLQIDKQLRERRKLQREEKLAEQIDKEGLQ
jgi:heme exporter protein D